MSKNQRNICVLLVTMDAHWRSRCMALIQNAGCEAYTASTGLQTIALLHTYIFDIVSIDDTIPDFGVIELSLTIKDIAANKPILLATGENIQRFSGILQRCGIFLAGTEKEFRKNLLSAIETLSLYGHPGRQFPTSPT